MQLTTPIDLINRSFKMYASRLENLNITTLNDLLYHIPSRYDDYSLITKVNTLQEGEVVTVIGTVDDIKNTYTRGHKMLQKATINDNTGTIDVMWFNQPFLTKTIYKGVTIAISGRVEKSGKGTIIISPEYEVLSETGKTIHTGRLVPIYPETKGVSSKWLRRQIYQLLQVNLDELNEFMPQYILTTQNLPDLHTALQEIHFPQTLEQAKHARLRLAFDELFLLQLNVIEKRNTWRKAKTGNRFVIKEYKDKIEKFITTLPFTLTNAQDKAIEDIFTDVANIEPMNRLIQGDVGSGKTVVATIGMYVAHLSGFQSVLMAPTEILAQQHYTTIKQLVQPHNIHVGLATGSKKENLENFDMLVGTHAVLSETVVYKNLGLVVIDEQQRFGVEQRALLRGKGNNPHLLSMTATPIPRTIALTMYGDLDISLLGDMPKGRKLIKTWLVPPEKRNGAYDWIRKQVTQTDSQIFIICPFIEESESMQTVKAAQVEFERLQNNVFSDLKLGLLHGKLKPKEKEQVLQNFRDKKYDILVATPVVEVGIDIPNATVIMIEASERFGLSQLHQLRGRVGRGDKQSYCLLFTQSKSPQTIQRLKALETIHVGSKLAELDLRIRGAGDIYGTKQSGFRMLKIASFSDLSLIERAKREALKIFSDLDKYPSLKEKMKAVHKKDISPD